MLTGLVSHTTSSSCTVWVSRLYAANFFWFLQILVLEVAVSNKTFVNPVSLLIYVKSCLSFNSFIMVSWLTNSLKPHDTYMRQWTTGPLLKIMAWTNTDLDPYIFSKENESKNIYNLVIIVSRLQYVQTFCQHIHAFWVQSVWNTLYEQWDWYRWCLSTHWGRDKMAGILLMTFSWMKIYKFHIQFHWSLFVRFQLTISQHWFR